MARARKGAARRQGKKKTFRRAKGFRGARHRLWRTTKETVMRAMAYATRDRKQKKREFRGLWIIRINAAVRARGLTYSKFIEGLNKANFDVNRKILAEIASKDAAAFDKIVALAKSSLN